MKINEGKGITVSRDITQTQSKKSLDGKFKKVMELAIQSEDNKGTAKADAIDPLLTGISILSKTNGIDTQSHFMEKQRLINKLEETMNLVDFYAAKLADPSKPLSTVDPLIGHLEQRLEDLKTMESTPELPAKLKPIISDMAITISTEIAKYKKGIYS